MSKPGKRTLCAPAPAFVDRMLWNAHTKLLLKSVEVSSRKFDAVSAIASNAARIVRRVTPRLRIIDGNGPLERLTRSE